MAYKPGFIENYACIYFSMLLPILQQQIYILISSERQKKYFIKARPPHAIVPVTAAVYRISC